MKLFASNNIAAPDFNGLFGNLQAVATVSLIAVVKDTS
jgi:hypothetical protein